MKETVLIIITIWTITGGIVLKQAKDENLEWWIILIRLILSPLLLVLELIELFWIKITSTTFKHYPF